MRFQDIVRLVSLAAIWGGSFIFMRVLAPVLGPVLTADLRVLIGGLTLVIYYAVIGFDPEWKKNWRQYLVIGAINSALPFLLYALAALHLPASYSVIFNSTSPIFGALFSVLWLNTRFSLRMIIGLLFGSLGVALVSKAGHIAVDARFFASACACLTAAACYGLGAVYIRRKATHLKPMAIAGGSQLMAGLLLVPLIPFSPVRGEITTGVVFNVLGLAVMCSALAYLLYYRLIADIGATKALTVTFLMPFFGMIWGAIYLGESISTPFVLGGALIVAGTHFVTRTKS